MQINKLLIAVFILGLVACGDVKNTRLMPPQLTYEQAKVSSEGVSISYNPQLDILFVLDNSKSMTEEIKYLKSNISSFVDKFANNSIIDWHIGVTYVHDSIRYNDEIVKKTNPNTGKIQYYNAGELIPVNGVKFIDRSHSKKDLETLFDVKTAPNFVENNNVVQFDYVSKNTIKKDKSGNEVLDENGKPVYSQVAIGPENEESFTAVKGALSMSSLMGQNKGFYRATSHTVIIFVTDAEDASSISSKQLFKELFDFKARNMSLLSAYGVLCKSGDKECLNIKSDGKSTIEIEAKKIKEFVNLVHQKKAESGTQIESDISPILNLRSNNWGEELAKIGEQIRKQTLAKYIQLKDRPEYDTTTEQPKIEVFYGDKKLPYDAEKGWTYQANKNREGEVGGTIIIHGGIDLDNYDINGQIRIQYDKVQYKDLSKPVE